MDSSAGFISLYTDKPNIRKNGELQKLLAHILGWCDEKSILFASLMKIKVILTKIVIRKNTSDDYFMEPRNCTARIWYGGATHGLR